MLHPLVHENTSTLEEQRFSSTFTGEELFLNDHQVKGEKVLPGLAYLEMARAAIEEASGSTEEGQTRIQLKNVVWARPMAVGAQPQEVHIGLYPEENGEIAYEIYSKPEKNNGSATTVSRQRLRDDMDTRIVHSQGMALFALGSQRPQLDLKALQERCTQSVLSVDECYEVFKRMGLEYGPAHKGIEKLYVGDHEVLAQLTLPSPVSETKDQFTLYPSLLASTLQASIGIGFTNQ